MVSIFCGTFLLFKKKGWCGLEGDAEMQSTDREEVLLPYLAVNEVKGQPINLNTRSRKWTCDLSPLQGLNHMVPDAQAADAQVSLS